MGDVDRMTSCGSQLVLFLCLSLLFVCDSKFADHPSAEELTPENFKSKVIGSKEVRTFFLKYSSFSPILISNAFCIYHQLWVVAFYAPWYVR